MKKSIIALSSAVLLSFGFVSPALASMYTVKQGDTLEKIAREYNLSVQQLHELNNLTSDVLQINQQLITSVPSISTQTKTYTVVKGDTLGKIAKKYHLTLAELKKLNALTSTKIHVGDKLIVSSIAATKAMEKENETMNNNSTQTMLYTVVKGDTLGEIAKKHNLTLEELKKLNPYFKTTDFVKIGQKIRVAKSVIDTAALTNDQQIDTVIMEAKKVINAPYLWTGVTPQGFDSSGFIYYSFKQAGYKISRSSVSTYYELGKDVSLPKPGDLVFFASDVDHAVVMNHVGIYLGDNKFIHVTESKGVQISALSSSYYQSRLIGYKRLVF